MSIEIPRRLRLSAILLFSILIIGTLGYWLITGGKSSVFECLYMTVITILTIGFDEIIKPETGNAFSWLRVFTMTLAFFGFVIVTYILSNVTALMVEGDLKETFKNRKNNKIIKKMENHFIVCGAGRVGSVIINELYLTKRTFVVIDRSKEIIHELEEKFPKITVINGDAEVEDVLLKAAIKNAAGIFAATGDDNQNLIISLTSKFINPNIRVVARCLSAANHNKMEKAGADAVITADFIAGMRMASEMIRPAAVSLLDKMLQNKEVNLRVEEIPVHEIHTGKTIAGLNLEHFPDTMLIAVVSEGESWKFMPKAEDVVGKDFRLVVITNPGERLKLKEHLSND